MSGLSCIFPFPAKAQPVGSVQHEKRKYDKRQCCYYCNSLVNHKLCDHFERWHNDIAEVAKVLSKPRSDKVRRNWEFKRLTNLGAFKYNINVLTGNMSGELIVVKRAQENANATYLPCPGCYGFYQSKDLWRHYKICKIHNSTNVLKSGGKGTSIVAAGRILLEGALIGDNANICLTAVKTDVIANMHQDEVEVSVKHDNMIVMYGAVLLRKLGNARANDIKQRMRQLGRLTMETRMSLNELLTGKNFEKVCDGVETIAGLHQSNGRFYFTVPSYALRVGHSITKCCHIKISQAIKDGDSLAQHEAETFQAVFNSDWTDRISSLALNSLKEAKYNKPEYLPVTEDVVLLGNYLRENINALLQGDMTVYVNWRKLLNLTLVRLITFNKRRPNEVASLTLSTYLDKPKWNQFSNPEIEATLSGVEKKLVQR